MALTQTDKQLLLSTLGTPETADRVIALLEMAGTGNMTGPGSSTDNALSRFDGLTGAVLQNSGVTLSDTSELVGTISQTYPQQAVAPAAPAANQQKLYFKNDGLLYKKDSANVETQVGASSGGDVVGPASSTDNAIVRYDGITGKLIQDSDVTLVNSTLGTDGTLILNAGSGLDNQDIWQVGFDGGPGEAFLRPLINDFAAIGESTVTPGARLRPYGVFVTEIFDIDFRDVVPDQPRFRISSADVNNKTIMFWEDPTVNNRIYLGMDKNTPNQLDFLDNTQAKLLSIHDDGSLTMEASTGADILWNTDGGGKIGELGDNRPASLKVLNYANIGNSQQNATESEAYYGGFLQVGSKNDSQGPVLPASVIFMGSGGTNDSKPEFGMYHRDSLGVDQFAYFEFDNDELSSTYLDLYYGAPQGNGNSFILKANGDVEFPFDQYIKHSFYSSDPGVWPEHQFRRARGTPSSPTAVQLADNSLGILNWLGYDGTEFAIGAQISVGVDQTYSAGNHGAHMHLWTTPINTASPVILQRLGSDSVVTTFGQFKLKAQGASNGSQEFIGMATDELRLTQDNNGQTINFFNTVSPTTAGNLMAINMHGNTGTQYARLDFKASENWGGGTFGTLFNLYTTLTGDVTKAVRFSIDGSGIGRFVHGVRTLVSSADVSTPPTQAEMVATFGAAATTGSGFTAYINDNGAGPLYLVGNDGTNYHYVLMTVGV